MIVGPDEQSSQDFRSVALPCLALLLRTARYLTHDNDAAEDLTQETMLRAFAHFDSFAHGSDIKAWLLTILRRTHIDIYRSNKKRNSDVSLDAAQALEVEADDTTQPGQFDDQWSQPEQLMERFEDQTMIAALKTLPEQIRWTLLLVDIQQMDHADAAGVLDVPVGTVKSRAYRGRRMLRDRLFAVAQKNGWVQPT